jgi:hypothetical protein
MSVSPLLRLLLAASLLFASAAQAQLFRAYLASDGSDANPCTVQAPCRLLPAALAAVKDGGEVWIMDSANFNTAPVVIGKSVSILAIPGAVGSVVGSGGDAILINAPGAKVALRNLKILNFQNGNNGINMTAGAILTVEDCEVVGFSLSSRAGIYVKTAADVTIVRTTVRQNWFGIVFDGGANGSVAHVNAVHNQAGGISAYGTVDATTTTVSVAESVANHNGIGFASTRLSGSAVTKLSVSRSTASHNDTGFYVALGNTITVSGSVASHNGTAFSNVSAIFRTLQDNALSDHATDVAGMLTLVTPK